MVIILKKKKKVLFIFFITFFILVVFCFLFLFFSNSLFVWRLPTFSNIPSFDCEQPILYVKEEKIKIASDSSYSLEDNIIANFGIYGGTIHCNGERNIGDNTITCIGVGNNKMETKISYILEVSATYQKNAIFFGDSIVQGLGSRNHHYSWANVISDDYDFSHCENAGISDYRVSTYDDPNKWLVDEVKSHFQDSFSYDYIILQGGINDVFYDTPLGSISNNSSYDERTFIGGLETYLSTVTSKWNHAKIGYILTYYTPNYYENGRNWSYDTYKKYHDLTIQVLEKWKIPYLDLFDDYYSKLLKVDTRKYLPDYLHLNEDGYHLIAPYIYNFMTTLEKR